MQPIVVSEKTFSRHVKIAKKSLAHSKMSLSQVRNLLARVYGHKSDHGYQALLKSGQAQTSSERVKSLVQQHYAELVNRFVSLGEVDGQVAKHVLKRIWPEYLGESLSQWRQHSSQFIFDQKLQHFLKEKPIALPNAVSGVFGCVYSFDGLPSIKNAIEAQGVPHTQVSLVLEGSTTVNSHDAIKPTACYTILAPGTEHLGKILKPAMPAGVARFLLDINLGRLAKNLRMLGFDTLLPKHNIDDAYLAAESSDQNRILLSRDKGLLMRSIVEYGYWVKNDEPKKQLDEVVRYYNLQKHCDMFSRCISCNGDLKNVSKQKIVSKLPPLIARDYHHFKQCASCNKVYWNGSHVDRMTGVIDSLSLQKKIG